MKTDLSHNQSLLIYGGTFDPPHVAHLALPQLAMRAIGAQAVVYVPARVSPLKVTKVSPAADRLAMLKLALRDESDAAIETFEIDHGQPHEPSYTIDTLIALRNKWGESVKLRLLIGADQLLLFPKWRASDRITQLAEPLVMVRPPMTAQSLLDSLPAGMDRAMWRARLLTDLPVMDVSSSMIRARVAAGESITGLVSPVVEAYIAEHGLYR
jgi:nicotinate-nucleotide adenylyltransferase